MPSVDPIAAFDGCPISMSDGKPCGRPLYKDRSGVDGQPVCIMHSHDMKKSPADVWENVLAILNRSSKANRLTQRYDFSGFVFLDTDFSQRKFDREACFKEATFTQFANFSKATSDSIVDFSGAIFDRDASFTNVQFIQEYKFSDATFNGSLDFSGVTFRYSVDFSGAKFGGSVNFSEVNFERKADFSRARFNSSANFSGAHFKDHSDFSASTITHGDFSRAIFHSVSPFVETTFLQRSRFFNTTFAENVQFVRSVFMDLTEFQLATFSKDAIFWNATFFAGGDFTGATFHRGGDFSNAVFGQRKEPSTLATSAHPSPAVADFRRVRFAEPARVLFHQVNKSSLEGLRLRLLMANVEAVRFDDVHWHEEGWRKIVIQDELDITKPFKVEGKKEVPKEESHKETEEETAVHYELVAIIYRQLINNFEKVRAFDLAEDCWYGVREMKRLDPSHFVLSGWLGIYYRRWWWLRWFGERFSALYLYQKASHYGSSHQRALEMLVFVLFAFAVAYPLTGLEETKGVRLGLTSWLEMFQAYLSGWFHSLEVATFQRATLYVTTSKLGRLLEIFESILVPAQVSLLLLALRRRFRSGSSSGS